MTSFDDSATLLPAVNWSSPTATTTKLPLATGTRGDCSRYIAGDDYQKVLDDTPYLVSNCHLAAEVMGVPLEDLGFWNPSKSLTAHSRSSLSSLLTVPKVWEIRQRRHARLNRDIGTVGSTLMDICHHRKCRKSPLSQKGYVILHYIPYPRIHGSYDAGAYLDLCI